MTAIPLQTPVHSRLGPSSAHRWLHCSGSPNLIAKLGLNSEDEGSEEAARGTVCHEISAECLLEDKEPWEFGGQVRKHGPYSFTVDGEMAAQIETCLAYVRSVFKQYEPMGAVMHVETRVYSELDPEAYGTADIRIEVPGLCIIIIDFKYGVVRVEPNDEQLKEYGYMAYERRGDKMRGAGEPRMIQTIIAQPRLPNPNDYFRDAKFTPKELEDWFVKTVIPGMQETRDPLAPLTMGDWCKFCPANTAGRCPAVFADVEALPVAAHPSTFTAAQLGELRKKKKTHEKFWAGIDKEVFSRMKDKGEQIPGAKLVHKQAHRTWKDKVQLDDPNNPGEVLIMSKDEYALQHIGEAAYEPASLRSPAQMETLPGGSAMTAIFAFKPDTGLTVADENDNREVAVGLMARAAAEGGLVI